MKENIFMYIGFIFLGVVVYLDFGKKIWGVDSVDVQRLVWYGVGCGILLFGLLYKKIKSSRL